MPARPPAVRLNDFYEVYQSADGERAQREGKRCMNCGAAFCMPDSGYGQGCPILNKIPEWNELVHLGRWGDAYDRLSVTNPLPEFTSRVCPAPCQDACIVGINEQPIQIKGIERAISDRAFDEGWVQPIMPGKPTGRHIAIVGSGPAGLSAADRLTRLGHDVTIYERSDRAGGLLMYGIPGMKLDKTLVQRRIDLLEQSGVRFELNADVGGTVDPQQLLDNHDAVLLAVGALRARELDLPGRSLAGVHLAMDYLTRSTQTLLGDQLTVPTIDAAQRDIVVIGGGDTGADCIGTALRQGCRSIINITRRAQPPDERDSHHPWPGPPDTYVLDYAHAEGVAHFGRDPREYQVQPLGFESSGEDSDRVGGVRVRRLDTGRDEVLPADLVLLSVGFTGHDTPALASAFGLDEDRGVLRAEGCRTGVKGLYAAGDCRRGASLVVWAIREGIDAAAAIHHDLVQHDSEPTATLSTSSG